MRFMRVLGTFGAVAAFSAGVTIGALVAWPLAFPQPAPPHDPVAWPLATAERSVERPVDPVVRFTLVAVGDMMAHTPQLLSAKTSGGYDFSGCFAPVASRIGEADLAVGNLETVLAGGTYTGYPSFNSPDAYAEAAIAAGFDVLTTANNHTLDRGPSGITTTLDALDRFGVLHTGTARSAGEDARACIAEAEGMRVAVIAYTYGMNGLTVPGDKPWMVNTIDSQKMAADVRAARESGADIVVVSIHNGVEYQRQPTEAQTKLERAMVDAGADVVLGSHPHVIQPMEMVEAAGSAESTRTAFVIHSLGNFLSNQRERYRDTGLIVRLEFEKNLTTGATSLVCVEYVPVWVDDTLEGGKAGHRVLPIADVLGDPMYPGVSEPERVKLRQAWDDTSTHLGSVGASALDPGALVFWQAPER